MRFPLALPRALPVLGLLAAAAFAQSPLTTFYTGGNGLPGDTAVYCNLTVHVPVSIQQLDVNAFGGQGSSAIELWTVPTTWVGNDTNQAAWTLRGSSAAVLAAPEGTPTVAPLTAPVVLAAGSYGLAIVYRGTFGPCYTNGNGSNQTFARAELTLNCGAAGGIFTGGINNPRVWNGSIHYTPAASGTVALRNSTGTGCVGDAASAYELFAAAPAFDLQNSGFSLLAANGGYAAGALQVTYAAPTLAAQVLPLGDDGQTSVTLSAPFPFPGGSTTSLVVCANGFVSVGNGNGTGYQPSAEEFLAMPQQVYACWHDYNPTFGGSGQVKFEETGGKARITWDGVYGYLGTGAGTVPSTFQLQFVLATGDVHFVFRSMNLVGGSAYGDSHLIGWSPGGASLDPGSRDLSVAVPQGFTVPGTDQLPLGLSMATRPLVGSTVQFVTEQIPAGSPFGAVLLGLSNPNLDLTALGMPGCFRYTDGLATLLFLAPGTSHTVSFPVPNAVGLPIYAQSVVLAPQANLTPLGAISSNGLSLLIGDL